MTLATLKDKRIRGDLIEMYKAINEQKDMDWVSFPDLRSDPTGPAIEIKGNIMRIRREFYLNQMLETTSLIRSR